MIYIKKKYNTVDMNFNNIYSRSTNLIISRLIDNTVIINKGTPSSVLNHYPNSHINSMLNFENSIFVVEKKYEKMIPCKLNKSDLYILDDFSFKTEIRTIIDVEKIIKKNRDRTVNIFCFDKIETMFINQIDYIIEIIFSPKIELESMLCVNNYKFLNIVENNKIIYRNNANDHNLLIKLYILNVQECAYLNIVKNISINSEPNGMGMENQSITFNILYLFPLITAKFINFKSVLCKFLWYMSGKTNIDILKNTGKKKSRCIKNDGGPIYGFNFRHYGATYVDCDTDYKNQGVDQVQNIINILRANSKNALVNLWNPQNRTKYQFLSDGVNLDCIVIQHSTDVYISLPFDIAFVALFTNTIALLTNLRSRKITIRMGYAYIKNIDFKEILEMNPLSFPILKIRNRKQQTIEDLLYSDFILENYRHCLN